MNARRQKGFTLIELMIVVAIIAVLAVVAVGAISKMIQRSRKAEIGAVFGALAAGEETYKGENGHYVALASSDGSYAPGGASDSTFYPVLGSGGSEPAAKQWKLTEPIPWKLIAFNYSESAMYCSYSGNAGIAPAEYPAADATWGVSFTPSEPAGGAWYYVAAECEWDKGTISHYLMRWDQEGKVISFDGD